MKKSILTVTLNPAVDVTTVVNGCSPRRTYNGCRQIISAGGKGINVSRVLNHLGVPTVALGIGSGATGKLIVDLLNSENIRNDFVRGDGMTRINVTVLDVKNKRQTRVLSPGQELSKAQMGAFEEKYTQRLAQSRAVVLSGRTIYNAPDDLYGRLICLAKKARVPAVLDTSGESLRKGIAVGPFMVKPNLEEARDALGCRLDTLTQKKNAIKKFHQFGISMAVLSMGKRGALASNGSDVLYAKPPSVAAHRDVGCGDALVAGFLYAYLRRMSFAQTIQWAVAAGTANAMNEIPGLIHRKNLAQLIKTITIRKI